MQNLMNAFLEKNLLILQRVNLIWKSTFFLRIWRKWLTKNKNKLGKTFITSNCYTCIELNAHAILVALNWCRENKSPEFFLTWLSIAVKAVKSFFEQPDPVIPKRC